jgi:hypothetical protein
MKPANEIEIKRNVYTFGVLVLLLSVLIGGSAWTWAGGAKETLENQIKRSSNLIDSLELKIANHDSTLTLRDKDIVNLRAQLDAAKDSKLPKQIQTITDFMYNATGKDGSTLVNYVQYMKPALGDSAGDLASRLLNTACLALQTFGGVNRWIASRPEGCQCEQGRWEVKHRVPIRHHQMERSIAANARKRLKPLR